MLEAIKTWLEDTISPELISQGLDDFEDYMSEPPSDPTRRQCTVYLDEGEMDGEIRTEQFVIQGQLPHITTPDRYLSVMWAEIWNNLDPGMLGFATKEIRHRTWYPGEQPAGGMTSFVYIEVQFISFDDDCYTV
jgi:hypothetical protein